MPRPLYAALCLLALLGGCSSNVPLTIRQSPGESLTLQAVQAEPRRFIAKPVRWGGALISVKNEQNVAELEILAKPLQDGGRPEATDNSLGRFRARVDHFLDPEIYQTGREITVYGTITGSVKDKIGEHDYVYPLVAPVDFHIWEKANERYARDWPISFGIGFGFGF